MRNGRSSNRRRSHLPTLRSGRAGVGQAVRPGDHILDRSRAKLIDFHVGQRPISRSHNPARRSVIRCPPSASTAMNGSSTARH